MCGLIYRVVDLHVRLLLRECCFCCTADTRHTMTMLEKGCVCCIKYVIFHVCVNLFSVSFLDFLNQSKQVHITHITQQKHIVTKQPFFNIGDTSHNECPQLGKSMCVCVCVYNMYALNIFNYILGQNYSCIKLP